MIWVLDGSSATLTLPALWKVSPSAVRNRAGLEAVNADLNRILDHVCPALS